MHYRTHPRFSAVPAFALSLSSTIMLAILFVPSTAGFLREQLTSLPWITLGVAGFVLLSVCSWFALSFAEVRRGQLRVRSVRSRQRVDLRALKIAEVHAKSAGGSRRAAFQLMMRLEDTDGRELWLPLNVWRDEDLLMARVLRATVDRRVRIDGDPLVVRRFSGLLNSYKSWDRQQAAA